MQTGKIIAVDFDGTLVEDKFPEIGEPKHGILTAVKLMQQAGNRTILWTCRTGENLEAAIRWCELNGLKFDAVNDNLEEIKAIYPDNARKVYADEYWDDKAISAISLEAYIMDVITGMAAVQKAEGTQDA